MDKYTPFYSSDTTIEYDVIDCVQKESRTNPGYPTEIEITAVKIHDQEIGEYLQSHLLETHEDQWIREIIDRLRMVKEVA